MKIAIAKEGANVSEHFGYCHGFQVYNIEMGKVARSTFLEKPGHRPGFLPKWLSENGINLIIAGDMGASAQIVFENKGIEFVVAAKGNVDQEIEGNLKGQLKSTESIASVHSYQGTCHE